MGSQQSSVEAQARCTQQKGHARSVRSGSLRLACALIAALACWPSIGQSQVDDQTRSKAESALRKMTPAEIERKLRDLGVTREEATRRAAEYGVSLDDYLKRRSEVEEDLKGVSQKKADPEQVESNLDRLFRKEKAGVETEKEKRDREAQEEPVKKLIFVPGFAEREEADSLQPFGYDIFQFPSTTFEPVINVATPISYKLAPGDGLELTVWGETKLNLQATVNRDGNIVVPEVGPVPVSGLTVAQVQDRLLRRMSAVYSGLKNGEPGANTFLDISLGKLRTIQVYVLGEVVKPGGYALSSMSTILHALYLSGGPTVDGTLRSVRAIRDGKVVGDLDVYEHIIEGEKAPDMRLQDGDVVHVRASQRRVAIVGQVVRPAIYEMKEKENLGQLISYAGGLRFEAYVHRVHIQRVVPFAERTKESKDFEDVDVFFSTADELLKSKLPLEAGDLVTIMRIGTTQTNRVTVKGPVKQPGDFELKAGMRVSDILRAADSLDRDAFSERGTLYRLLPNLRREVMSFNPRLAMSGDAGHDLLLKSQDTLELYRERMFFPSRTVSIGGAVRNAGTFPRYEGMRVSDLIVMAGGFRYDAMNEAVEVTRMDTLSVERFGETFKVNMTHEFWKGQDSTDVVLRDLDHVVVPFDPRFSDPKVVRVYGYVMLEGDFTLRFQGEKLADLIERAGGLRPGAFLQGARLIRKQAETGLIPVDFEAALKDRRSLENVDLVNLDSIYVPPLDNVVYVRGEVYTPSGVVHRAGASLQYYINQAGGATKKAETGDVSVTLPNGRRWEPGWFIFPDPDILPGSQVFVPTKIETVDNTLPVLRDLVTVLASLAAITVALVQVTK